jgi:hypothetical protein
MTNQPDKRRKRVETNSPAAIDRLFEYASKMVGSEERARAMLEAGKLKLRLVSELPRRAEAPKCGACARSSGKPCRKRPRRPLQAARRAEHWSPRTPEGRRRLREAARARWRA